MKRTNISLELISLIGANIIAGGANIAVIAGGHSGVINWIAAVLSSFVLFALIWQAIADNKATKRL